ncbi:hypothetical protein V5799_005899, partial [Amblyomma americanum]
MCICCCCFFEEGSTNFLAWVRTAKELIRGPWTPVDIAFKVDSNFKVEFHCNLRANQYNPPYCAIDAIRLDDCKGDRAPQDNLCNFEDGWCSWRNKDSSRNKPGWQLGGGTMKTSLLRPREDHTFENDTTKGSYLFFSNYQRKTGDRAELIGDLLPDNMKITQCAEFWYIISGDKTTKLEVLSVDALQPASKDSPHWRQEGGRSLKWQLGRVAVPNYRRVVFRGTAGPASTPAYTALDDIAIRHHDRCETFPQGAEALSAADLLSCSFQSADLCHWMSLGLSSRQWIFGTSYLTALGPLSLPKNGRGGVAYLVGPRFTLARGTVQLQSHAVGPQEEPSCFSVWYHMFGGRGATLSLSVSKPDTVDRSAWRSSLVFRQRDRTTADRWYNVRRTVSLDGVHNKLTFDLSNPPSQLGSPLVALGPLNLTPGMCEVMTDGEGYCDFEYDTCSWIATKGWQRQRKQKSALRVEGLSGPVNSAYIVKATQRSTSPSGAELTSPEWQGQSEPRCLEFWYRTTGKAGSQLQAEVLTNGKSEVVWKKPSYQGPEWMLARAEIVQEKNFQVVFRAKFSDDPNQSLSLDDIVLRPEPCAHPAECDFVDGLCGYVNKFQGDFRWLVGSGRLETPQMQPAWPKGQGRRSSFAYLDLTTGKARNDVSKVSQGVKTVGLLSPLFDVTDDNTAVTFDYFRSGPDITSANLSVSCYGDSVAGVVQLARELDEVTNWATANQFKSRQSKPDVKPPPATDSPTRCTFEEGTMCGWKPTDVSIKWALNDPSKKIPDFPRFDHTVKAYRGRFLFASNNEINFALASIESPVLDVNATNGACLSFWLFTVHAYHNNFAVFADRQVIFQTNAHSSHRWQHVLVDFRRTTEKFKLLIQAFFGRGLVGLDDIQVDSGRCPPRDFCSWEEGSPCLAVPGAGSFSAWKPRNAALFGIPDHTLKNLKGRYLYLNTTGVESHHPVSRVFMQTRPPTDATCVTFWWSGRGATSQLNVYMFTKETILRDPLVSVNTPDEDGLWVARTVTITSRTNWN